MKTHFHTGVTEECVCFNGICHGTPSPVIRQDRIIDMLHTKFYFGHAKAQHSINMLTLAPVRAGFERDRNATDGRGLIICLHYSHTT
jgi:hypothetical protein